MRYWFCYLWLYLITSKLVNNVKHLKVNLWPWYVLCDLVPHLCALRGLKVLKKQTNKQLQSVKVKKVFLCLWLFILWLIILFISLLSTWSLWANEDACGELPDEVQEGVCRCHDRTWAGMVVVFLWSRPRVNDQHQHDANNDSNEGGPQVVGDGQDTQSAAGLRVHGWQARHKTAWGNQTQC